MSFQDKGNSVQSLLALLRSTQDGTPPITPPVEPVPGRNGISQHHSGKDVIASSSSGSGLHAVPSTQQLSDLLRSINGPAAPLPVDETYEPGPKVSRNHMQPFGPMANLPTPTRARQSIASASAKGKSTNNGQGVGDVDDGVGIGPIGDKEDIGLTSFARALPKLGELMGDERFMRELRNMKGEQDALERRLLAKQETIKAEHERSIQAERDIAKIAQKPISAEKKAAWASKLDRSLRDFHTKTCLSSLDSLSARQRKRLSELGAPGLGGDVAGIGTVARWRKIMDLLQAGFEE